MIELKDKSIEEMCLNYLPLLKEIDKLLRKDKDIIIAIDGLCGSGKSYLANLISLLYDCNVFHMDDYFLPFEMKTKERLSVPGSNVHYERFKDEILTGLVRNESIIYQPYQCATRDLAEPIQVESKKLNIVEGTYSLHPTLVKAYDYKVFLTVNPEVQKNRILKRNGEEKLQQFIHMWIPLEKLYFDSLHINMQCDKVIDTTDFWHTEIVEYKKEIYHE